MRMSAVRLCVRCSIGPRGLYALQLDSCRRRVASTHRFSLDRRRIVADPVWRSVERHVPGVHNGVSANDRLVHESVANDVSVHTHHCRVVCKPAAAPFPADKADAHVAVAVINSAVVPDAIAPVAVVENVVAAVPSPPRRRPERSLVGRRHPLPWNPVVAVISIGPITGNPHPTFLRTGRLFVHWQDRRSDRDGDRYCAERCRWNEQQHQHWQKPARRAKETHRESSLDAQLVLNKYAFSMTSQGWPKPNAKSMGLERRHHQCRLRIIPPGLPDLQPCGISVPNPHDNSRGQTSGLEPPLIESVVRRK